MKQHTKYVFTRKGKKIRNLTDYMLFLCKRAGVPYGRKVENGITFHDIRRTVKTNMLHAGVDKVYRDSILGHAFEGMDKHYLVVDETTLTEAMNRYTTWFDDQVNKVADVYQNVYQK